MFSYSSTYAQLDLLKKVSKSADKLINPIDNSDKDISNGLTEALKISVNKSCHEASSFGGFLDNKKIKISFPDEIIRVKKACLKLGLNDLILNFENKLNKTAEHVSVKASAIILIAVYDLKFTDALEILNGHDNSATLYLRNKSSKNLYQSFYPIVQKEIENTGVNHLLDDIIKRYNQIPFIKKVDFDLSDYITIKTIDGIFYLIAEKEGEIRNNPDARVTGLLKKIFK
jgi:hypothetical protein